MIAEALEMRRAWSHLALDADRLRALQRAKLAAVVRSAWENVPFWRDRLDRAGISPDRVRGIEDLSGLPPVTKAEVTAAGAPRVLARGVDRARCLSAHTSGTTGEPLTIYASADEVRVHRIIQFRALLTAGYRPREHLVVLGPGRALPTGWHQRLGLFRRDHLWPTLPVDEQIAALRRLSPDLLWIYPSCLYAILERTGFRLSAVCRPRAVFTSAEIFAGAQRQGLVEDGGIEHFDLYGCVEFGRIAWECRAHGGLHVNVDHVVLEVVGDHGRCPETGAQLGEAVLTSLTNLTMPLLRYRLGDVVGLLDGPCGCGCRFPRITHPLGRTRDLLRLPDGLGLTAGPMTHFLRRRDWVARFQIVQEDHERLRLRVVARRPPSAEEVAEVEREARSYMRDQVTATVELVERIEQAGRKYRDVIGLPAGQRPSPA